QENAFVYDDCGIAGLVEISRSCRIPLSRASRSTIGTSMNSLQMYTAYHDGFLIPWQKDTPEDFKTVNELLIADRGGFVFEPPTGIHEKVGELDFSGLYPMLMYSRNISPETIHCNCCPDSLERVPELNYNICNRKTGIVSKSLAILLTKRQAYKQLAKTSNNTSSRDDYKKRSDALKWILVCSFGYLGFKNARFGKIDAHISVCAFSRDVLSLTEKFVGERGYKLLHGIVDSTWLKNENAISNEYEMLARDLEGYFGLPISFESIYRWIVFLPSKVYPNRPVLNRYYGVFSDGQLKVRGIAIRRHDTSKIVQNLQTEVLELLGRAKNCQEFKELLPDALKIFYCHTDHVRSGGIPSEDLLVRKNLSKDPFQYSHRVPQALAAKQLKDHGFEVSGGQTVSYILLDRKNVVAQKLADEHVEYDTESYVSLLIDGFSELLSPFGFEKKGEWSQGDC
ncbi:MAG TPA: DNA polymerase domain-containing protein, partial [Candidatus Binatus sp.]|nr:DNA polymerase domain-containing protein [Candidatus Binatus sp.]